MTQLIKKHSSRMSTLLVRSRKPGSGHRQQNEAENAIDLSPIQVLAAEIKLQILVEAANVSVMKSLVIACPAFYPVYCENRYRLLLNAYRKSQCKHNDVLAEVVLKIRQIQGSEFFRRITALSLFKDSDVE